MAECTHSGDHVRSFLNLVLHSVPFIICEKVWCIKYSALPDSYSWAWHLWWQWTIKYHQILYSEICNKRPLWWETNFWGETTFTVTWPYISIDLYLWAKTTCHIRPLAMASWGGLSSQISLHYMYINYMYVKKNLFTGVYKDRTLTCWPLQNAAKLVTIDIICPLVLYWLLDHISKCHIHEPALIS